MLKTVAGWCRQNRTERLEMETGCHCEVLQTDGWIELGRWRRPCTLWICASAKAQVSANFLIVREKINSLKILFYLIRTQFKAALTWLLGSPCYCYLEIRPPIASLDLARIATSRVLTCWSTFDKVKVRGSSWNQNSTTSMVSADFEKTLEMMAERLTEPSKSRYSITANMNANWNGRRTEVDSTMKPHV